MAIRAVFRKFDADGSGAIDFAELGACLRVLGAHVSEADAAEMFRYAHVTTKLSGSGAVSALSFKEFLLCLAIGAVLQLFPMMRTAGPEAADSPLRGGGLPVSPSSASEWGAAGERIDAVASSASGGSATASASAAGGAADWGEGASRTSHSHAAMSRASTGGSEAGAVAQVVAQSGVAPAAGRLEAEGQSLVRALKLVIEAWVLFDTDGSGAIDREEVLAQVDRENSMERERRGSGTTVGTLSRTNSGASTGGGSTGGPKRKGLVARFSSGGHGTGTSHHHHVPAHGHTAPTTALLSRERWAELQVDPSGRIGFREFIFAFMAWVGVDDEEDEDEAAEAEAAAGAMLQAGARSALPSASAASGSAPPSPAHLPR